MSRWRVLVEHWPLKLLSLLLAVLLWLAISGEKTSEMGLRVPLELQNVPADLELVADLVSTVEVRLRASPRIIHRLGPSDVSIQLDLSGVSEGDHIYHLTDRTIRRPFGVTIVKISPSVLTVKLDRTVDKVVPIRARVEGKPAEGHELADVVCDPPSVRVTGPRSRLLALREAFTEPVPIDGARADLTRAVMIGVDEPLVRIQGSPRANVRVTLTERQEARVVEGVRVEVRGGPGTVRPKSVRVSVSGSHSAVSRLTADSLRAVVDAREQTRPRLRRVAIELAPGITLDRVEPESVWVVPQRSP
jgi:YbbR domain-containing protein